MKLRIDPEAKKELKESAAWYEKKRAGPGLEFLAAADVSLQSIR